MLALKFVGKTIVGEAKPVSRGKYISTTMIKARDG
jgi:hypothetical protein